MLPAKHFKKINSIYSPVPLAGARVLTSRPWDRAHTRVAALAPAAEEPHEFSRIGSV